MHTPDLADRIGSHVRALSAEVGARPVGSVANQRAEEYIARAFAAEGYDVARQAFDCEEWTIGPVELECDGEPLPCVPNPYGPRCDVRAVTVPATSLGEPMGCPDAVATHVRARLRAWPGLIEAEPWPQSDHFLFRQAGVPCLAFTFEDAMALVQSVIHTPADTPDVVDPAAIAAAVAYAAEIAGDLAQA